jgi:SHAQKYF class myb-like DNA-binding protein
MIDDKNLMYLPNETQILNQPIQESNKVENNLNSTQNEAGLDNEIKNEENYLGNNGRWRRNEHIRFLGGCLQYGNNWKKVETYVRTRTSTQIRSHAQKYLKKLEKKYYPNGCAQNQNTSSNDSFTEEINNNNTLPKNTESKDISEDKKQQENSNNNENNQEQNNNKKNEQSQPFNLKNEEFITVDNKTKLSDEKIKKLVEDLPKPNFNIEVVEKIILKIFRINKKFEDFPKSDINKKNQKGTPYNKNNKNIFLCQKQKRETNYEQTIKDLLSTNNQNDLQKLKKIFEERDSILYNILIKQLNDN